MIWRNVWLEERTLGGTDASENGWYSCSHHTIPMHPLKMDVLPKSFHQIILAASEGFNPPNMQRRPLPSLLSDSSSMVRGDRTVTRYRDSCSLATRREQIGFILFKKNPFVLALLPSWSHGGFINRQLKMFLLFVQTTYGSLAIS